MSYLDSIILGIVQGLSEFLPISSSAHLVLFRNILDINNPPLLFDVLLHFSTLIVVLVYYKDIVIKLITTMFKFIFRKDYDKSLMNININLIISTIVTIVFVLVLKKLNIYSNSLTSISICMLITAFMLLTLSFIKPNKKLEKMSKKDSIIIGAAQGFGTLSGISRSGITISSSTFCKIERESSATYSFLLSIFAILGALVFSIHDYINLESNVKLDVMPTLCGCIFATLFGFLALKMLVWLVKSAKLWYFSIYLTIVSLIILIYL